MGLLDSTTTPAATATSGTAATDWKTNNQWGWNYGDGSLTDVKNYYSTLGTTDAERNQKVKPLTDGSVWAINDNLSFAQRSQMMDMNGGKAVKLSQDAQQFLYDKGLEGVRSSAQQVRDDGIQGFVTQGMTPAQAQEAQYRAETDSAATRAQNGAVASGTNSAAVSDGALSTYTPTLSGVDPNGLVENRLAGILSSDSPTMQAARLQALQEGNARGLLNSSMTVSAANKAMTEAALPIAQADAATVTNQNLTNQAAANTAGQFNTNWSNDLVKLQQQQANAMESAKFDATTRAELQTSMNSFTAGQSAAQRAAALQLANINNSANATQENTRYAQDIYGKLNAMPEAYSKYLISISADQTMDDTAKAASIKLYTDQMNAQQTAYRAQLSSMSFSPGTYFNFSTSSGVASNFNPAGQTNASGLAGETTAQSVAASGLLGSTAQTSSLSGQTGSGAETGQPGQDLGLADSYRSASNNIGGVVARGLASLGLPATAGNLAAAAIPGSGIFMALNALTGAQLGVPGAPPGYYAGMYVSSTGNTSNAYTPPQGSYMSSGNENYSPYGGASSSE